MTSPARVLRSLIARVRQTRDPIGYAKRIGVQVKGEVHFYGARPGMFGSEPWMITLGDGVHIAGECQFLTHDGGTLVLRKEYPDLEWSAPIVVEDDVYIGFPRPGNARSHDRQALYRCGRGRRG